MPPSPDRFVTRDVDDLIVEVVDDEQRFLALENEWNELLQSSRSNNVFLTWEWIVTWWEVYGRASQLHVLVAREKDGRAVGIAPLKAGGSALLRSSGLERIEFIGSGGDVTPEYLDFIVQSGLESRVTRAFFEHLAADPSVGALDLRPFAAQSPNLQCLLSLIENRGGRFIRSADSVCPTFELPSTREQFLAGRSRNYRKKIGEYERRCRQELGARLRVSATKDEVIRDMTSLIDLHSRRWRGRSRAFRSPQYIHFHQRLAALLFERGWVRLFSLEVDQSIVASLYCFSYAGRFYYYQSGRDPQHERRRVGLVLMHLAIQEAIAEGAKTFDFLRGKEEYKSRWAESSASNVRVVFWTSGRARVASAVRDAVRLIASLPERGTALLLRPTLSWLASAVFAPAK